MSYMRCKLCHKNRMLAKKSHIIPNFMYKGLFDEKHNMIYADLKQLDKPGQVAQTGYFDKNILCPECELGVLGALDSYASSVIYGTKRHTTVIQVRGITNDGLEHIRLSGLDPVKFKSFILSILWRSHLSRHHFFKGISLNDQDAENLRKVFLPEPEKNLETYLVTIIGVLDSNKRPAALISTPFYQSDSNGKFAVFLINGFLYTINIGENKYTGGPKKFSLTENGEMIIPLLTGEHARRFMHALNLPARVVNYFTP